MTSMAIGGLPSQTSARDDDGVDAPIMAEINITPLTDIFLVLLIIFMVTSSVMSQLGVDVKLPETGSGASSQAQEEGLVVTLLPDARMRVGGVTYGRDDWNGVRQAIGQELSRSTSKLVVLEGDRSAFLGVAVKLMDEAKKAGAEKFAIATMPE